MTLQIVVTATGTSSADFQLDVQVRERGAARATGYFDLTDYCPRLHLTPEDNVNTAAAAVYAAARVLKMMHHRPELWVREEREALSRPVEERLTDDVTRHGVDVIVQMMLANFVYAR